ncbi:MAG: hypothetical protein K9N51_00725 [Candidatus Pacebacteria bacterium]|nr:hypothetical protein [Candidatus Paceibacterota bacterium]
MMIEQINIDRKALTLTVGDRTMRIGWTRMLRGRVHNLSVDRDLSVSDFEPRLVQPLADGVRLQLVNEDHGLFIPVELRAEGDGFRLRVKAGWICEQMSINRRLMALDVLPDCLMTQVGAEGFYLLPDFSGTIVRFNNQAPGVVRDRIYMHQSQWEKFNVMNCFGLKQDGAGTLVIVHEGDFFCHAVTEVNQEGRNRLYASFGLRHGPSEPIKQEDKEIIVRFTRGRADGFWDLARAYRDYLVNDRGVSPLKQRIADNPVLAYSVAAMRTKIFHGLKPRSLDGNVPMKTYATFAQTEDILDCMQAAGLTKAVITLVGWNLGGHDGAYPQRFPVEGALGGEKGLRRLIAKAKSMGYQIVPHDNLTDMYMAGQTYDQEVLLRHDDHTPVLGGIWGGGQSAKSCPLAYFDRYGPDVMRIRDLGFAGHYYCDAQSNPLFRCHDPQHPADEEQFAISQCKLLQAYRVLYGAVSQEVGPAYSLPFIDEIAHIHMPTGRESLKAVNEDFERIVDRVVPFYQLAIHGLVTYQDKWVHVYGKEVCRKELLRALAYGARPSMEVSYIAGANGGHYEESIQAVGEAYKTAFNELAGTHVEMVEDYEELGPETSRVEYGDGTRLTVNWGDVPVAGVEPLKCKIERTPKWTDSSLILQNTVKN